MKKINVLLTAVLISGMAHAQKSVAFKIKFLPKHIYKITNNMHLDMHMKLPDSIAKLSKMPPEGVNVKLITMSVLSVKTGAPVADGSFPYQIKYDTLSTKTVQNNTETPIPMPAKIGTIITGRCTPEGKMHLDSVPNAKTDPQTQKMIMEMVNKMADQIKFPEKPMTIGESFTQDMPFALPIPGQSAQFNIKCTYKLTGIKGKEAYFDMVMSINMDMINAKAPNGSMAVKGTGEGAGTIVYLIDKNFPVQHLSNMNMHMDMMMKNVNMHMDMKANYDIKTEISAN